jgi:hypothetical protein
MEPEELRQGAGELTHTLLGARSPSEPPFSHRRRMPYA